MAEVQETVLVEVQISKPEAEKEIDQLTKSISELNEENKELLANNKALEQQGQKNSKQHLENSRQIEVNKQKITENTASRKGLIQTIVAEDNSIKSLSIRNKELINQRNLISTSTDEGRKRIANINAELDKNNEAIKNNSSALEKQRFNIGNYASALDGIVPGLGGFITGIQNATKAGLAFIATPIGAILAGIALALSSLIAYFKGSEEGQNRLNEIMLIGSSIMEKVMDLAEGIGEALYNAFTNPKQALVDLYEFVKQNLINRFTAFKVILEGIIDLDFKKFNNGILQAVTGTENVIDKVIDLAVSAKNAVNDAIDAGKKLAALQAQIDKNERDLITERARVSLEVAKLRAKAIEEEGDTKKATIEEAIKLEDDLSKKEVALAKIRLANAKLTLETNGADKAALDEVAKATAAVMAAEQSRFDATLRFQKELERLRDEEKTEQQRIEDEQEANNQKVRDDNKKKAEDEQARIEKEQADYNKNYVKKKKDEVEADKRAAEQKKEALESLNKIFKEHTIAGKALSVAQATINTYQGATEILKQKSTLPSPLDFITKAVNFAATIAAGLGAVRAITGVGFAKGGILGEVKKFFGGGIANNGGVINGPSHAAGGVKFSVGGKLGFEAEGGEAIINRRSTAMFRNQLSAINQAGGGVRFASGGIANDEIRSVARGIERQFTGQDTVFQPVLILEQFELKQTEVNNVKNRAVVIS